MKIKPKFKRAPGTEERPSILSLQNIVHETAKEKGFWGAGKRNLGEKIALIHSELSELLETYRKDPDAPSEKCPETLTVEEEEMADVLIRLLDLAAHRGIDLEAAAWLKHRYNRTRPPMHGKKF